MDVPPGSYTIAVGWPSATYYPGVVNVDDIQSVPVSAGQLVGGLNFAVDRRSGVRVRGRIMPLPGQDVTTLKVGIGDYVDRGERVSLFNFHYYYPELGLIPVQPDGSFEFPIAPPGIHALRVFPQTTSIYRNYSEQRLLVVEGRDVNVDLPPTVFIKGRLVSDDGGQLPITLGGLLNNKPMPVCIRVDGQESYTADVWLDGSFSLLVRAGQYRVSIILPFGYYAKSFSFGTTDLLRAPLDLSRASSSEILGTVTSTPPDSAKGYVTVRGHANLAGFNGFISPLVAVLQAEGSDRMGYFVVSGGNSFEIRGVPPGTYHGYVMHRDFVPLPGERHDFGKTIVVADKDLNDVELPLIVNPHLIR